MKIQGLFFSLALACWSQAAFAQGTAFTYQGRLNSGASAAGGTYEMTFALFNAAGGGGQISYSLTNSVVVTNGLFTVSLDFGPQFYGLDRWLEIGVRTNGGATNSLLSPRQKLTPTPYALYAPQAGSATIAGGVSVDSVGAAGLQASSVTSAKIADGSITAADVAAASFSTTFWKVDGNAGTTPGTHFVGTTDNQPLELKVNNQRGLRLEPTTNLDTVNVIGGSARNSVGAGVVGATIGGGGTGDWFGGAFTNRVGDDFGTVSGGADNTIQTFAKFATIGGGQRNLMRTGAFSSTIGGGSQNTNDAGLATIGGGWMNAIQYGAQYATIGGGNFNAIHSNALYSAIGGGYFNSLEPNLYSATISGGQFNSIQTYGYYATIGGGYFNAVQPYAEFATIPGGRENSAASYGFAAGRRAKAYHTGAFVWGDSTDEDFASTGTNQFLIRAAGGVGINKNNPATALDVFGTITATSFSGNGAGLTLSPNVAFLNANQTFTGNNTIAPPATLSFGATTRQMLNLWGADYGIGVQDSRLYFRTAYGPNDGFAWFHAGSHTNTADDPGPGGTTLMTLDPSGLTVSNVKLLTNPNGGIEVGPSSSSGTIPFIDFHYGTGVAQDYNVRLINNGNGQLDIASSFSGTPMARFNSGGLTVNGTFVSSSDRNVKENFAPVQPREVLEKVVALPITRWNYKSDAATPHLGPVAQDFYAAFAIGPDDKHISTVDADGVALAAIQGLNQKLEEKETRINELEKRLAALEKLIKSQNREETHP